MRARFEIFEQLNRFDIERSNRFDIKFLNIKNHVLTEYRCFTIALLLRALMDFIG